MSNVLTGGDGNDVLRGKFGADTLNGGAGADLLVGGSGIDTMVYSQASDSTSVDFDTIRTLSRSDKFQLWFQVTGLDHQIGGSLNSASFDSDLSAGTAGLEAHHAVVFHATSGTDAGDYFLVIDANGQAGYQAGEDLVIRLDNANINDHYHLSLDQFVTT